MSRPIDESDHLLEERDREASTRRWGAEPGDTHVPSVRRPASRGGPSEEELSFEALAVRVRTLENLVQHVREEIGDVARPAKRAPGSGIWGAMHENTEAVNSISKRVDSMNEKLDQFIRASEQRDLDAKRIAEEKEKQSRAAMAPYRNAAWEAVATTIKTVVTAGVGAGIYWLTTLHH